MKTKIRQKIFLYTVLALMAGFLVKMIFQFIPPKPDAVVNLTFAYEGMPSKIKVFLDDKTGVCDLEMWERELPAYAFVFDSLGASLGLWERGEAKAGLNGTILVLKNEPWYVHPIGKVAGIASYKHGIDILCEPFNSSLLFREWFLMLMCDMGGLDNYEEECLTKEAKILIGSKNYEET